MAGFAETVIPTVEAKTADYTCAAGDAGKVFTTLGATGAVIFTLPSAASTPVGTSYTFMNCVDQDMTVGGTAGQLVYLNDVAANSVAFSTASEKIGGCVKATCVSAAKWFIETPVNELHTVTVAT